MSFRTARTWGWLINGWHFQQTRWPCLSSLCWTGQSSVAWNGIFSTGNKCGVMTNVVAEPKKWKQRGTKEKSAPLSIKVIANQSWAFCVYLREETRDICGCACMNDWTGQVKGKRRGSFAKGSIPVRKRESPFPKKRKEKKERLQIQRES